MAFAEIWKPCIWHSIYLSHSKVLSLKHNCALQVSAGHRWGLESFLCSFPMVFVEARFNLWFCAKGRLKRMLHTHQSLRSEPNVSFCLNANRRNIFSYKYGRRKGSWEEAGWCLGWKLSQWVSLWWDLVPLSRSSAWETESPVCPKSSTTTCALHVS